MVSAVSAAAEQRMVLVVHIVFVYTVGISIRSNIIVCTRVSYLKKFYGEKKEKKENHKKNKSLLIYFG